MIKLHQSSDENLNVIVIDTPIGGVLARGLYCAVSPTRITAKRRGYAAT
jgi:hypothetical protein